MAKQVSYSDEFQRSVKRIAHWRTNPVDFVRDNFKIEPDEWQVEFLTAYAFENRIAAKACKGPGKTAVLSWCAWHFMVCYPHPKIVATSITGDNLRDGLWAELAKWQSKSPFLQEAFDWKAERVTSNDHPETWFMTARKWSQSADKSQQANALAGLHEDYILFIIDEAGGVPDAVVAAAEAALANAGSELAPNAIAKLLICGNPTHLTGPLYRACSSEASLWHVIEITGDPENPKRSKRISLKWAQEQIKKYGRDNPWVMINVLGKFPPSSVNALLGPDDVEKAMINVLPPEVYMREPRILGVDVALQGSDRTVIAPRMGLVAFKPKILRMTDPKDIASTVAMSAQKFKADAIFVDNTGGWGSGVVSYLNDWGYNVIGVQFAGKANENIYYNKRTEMIHELAYWVKGGGCLPRDNELKEELCAQTFFHKKDKLLMTEKAQIKEDLGRSPDLADAYALTFAFPVIKQVQQQLNQMNNATSQEYNPVQKVFPNVNNNPVADYNPMV